MPDSFLARPGGQINPQRAMSGESFLMELVVAYFTMFSANFDHKHYFFTKNLTKNSGIRKLKNIDLLCFIF